MSPYRRALPRRRAGRSLLALGAALLLTSGCLGWGQRGFDAGKTGYNPTEKALTAATVADLAPVWNTPGAGQVVSSRSYVHVLRTGPFSPMSLTTYDAKTGQQVWTKLTAFEQVYASQLAVHGGDVLTTVTYLQQAMGHNLPSPIMTDPTYDAATGAAGQPDPFLPEGDDPPPGLMGSGNAAYGDHMAVVPYASGLRVIHDDDTTPDQLIGGTDPLLNERGGLVYVTRRGAERPTIDAFLTSCPFWDLCGPRWSAGGSTTMAVYEASTNTLFSWEEGFAITANDGTHGQDKWLIDMPVLDARPATRDGTLFAVSGGHLAVAPPCDTGMCSPTWTGAGPAGPYTPVIGGDVAYVASTDAGATTVDAYDADGCGSATCTPLASVTAPGTVQDMLVAGGRFIVQTDQGVYAFGLPT